MVSREALDHSLAREGARSVMEACLRRSLASACALAVSLSAVDPAAGVFAQTFAAPASAPGVELAPVGGVSAASAQPLELGLSAAGPSLAPSFLLPASLPSRSPTPAPSTGKITVGVAAARALPRDFVRDWSAVHEGLARDAARQPPERLRVGSSALFENGPRPFGAGALFMADGDGKVGGGSGLQPSDPQGPAGPEGPRVPPPSRRGFMRRIAIGWKTWVIGGVLLVVTLLAAWQFMAPRLHPVPTPPPGVIDERYPFHMERDAGARLERANPVDSVLALSLVGHRDTVESVSISEDGKEAVTVAKDGSWKVWNLEKGEAISPTDYPGKARGALFADGGRKLIIVDQDSTVRIVDRTTGDVRTITQGVGALAFHSFSPDAQRLAVASKDGRVQTLDLRSNAVRGYQQDGRVLALGSTKKGVVLLTARKGIVKLWSIPPGGEPAPLAEKYLPGAVILSTAIDEAGEKAFLAADMGGDQAVVFWTVGASNSKIIGAEDIGGPGTNIVGVAIDRAGRQGAMIAEDGRIWLYDSATDKTRLVGKAGGGARVSFSADGTRLYTTERGGTVRIWKARP